MADTRLHSNPQQIDKLSFGMLELQMQDTAESKVPRDITHMI